MAKDTVIKILTLFQQVVNEDDAPYTFAKLLVELGVLKISAMISQLSFSTPSQNLREELVYNVADFLSDLIRCHSEILPQMLSTASLLGPIFQLTIQYARRWSSAVDMSVCHLIRDITEDCIELSTLSQLVHLGMAKTMLILLHKYYLKSENITICLLHSFEQCLMLAEDPQHLFVQECAIFKTEEGLQFYEIIEELIDHKNDELSEQAMEVATIFHGCTSECDSDNEPVEELKF
jgi:hypothetical protein